LETFLTRKKVSFIRIDGKTKSSHRTRMVDEFQAVDAAGDGGGGGPQVALLSITAAGVGIELFSAHTVVFAELYWTCGALVQAEDRCHRIGQTHDVTIHYLLGKFLVELFVSERSELTKKVS
jgi:SWI/SNF-related matrix-associated actin-dependent regulator 1 of chromatin subfamily A